MTSTELRALLKRIVAIETVYQSLEDDASRYSASGQEEHRVALNADAGELIEHLMVLRKLLRVASDA